MIAPDEQHRRDILLFEAGGARFGLFLIDVREVTRAVTVLPLPRAPAIIEGVINVRGRVVPVFDIRTRFRLPARPITYSDQLLLAFDGRREVALHVDRVDRIVSVEARYWEEPQAISPGLEYVAGIARLPDGLVLIHDLRTFLSQAEALRLDEALSQREHPAPEEHLSQGGPAGVEEQPQGGPAGAEEHLSQGGPVVSGEVPPKPSRGGT